MPLYTYLARQISTRKCICSTFENSHVGITNDPYLVKNKGYLLNLKTHSKSYINGLAPNSHADEGFAALRTCFMGKPPSLGVELVDNFWSIDVTLSKNSRAKDQRGHGKRGI